MIAKTNDKLVSVVGFNLIMIGISFNIMTISRVVSTFWSRLYLQFVIASRKDAPQLHNCKMVSAIYIDFKECLAELCMIVLSLTDGSTIHHSKMAVRC